MTTVATLNPPNFNFNVSANPGFVSDDILFSNPIPSPQLPSPQALELANNPDLSSHHIQFPPSQEVSSAAAKATSSSSEALPSPNPLSNIKKEPSNQATTSRRVSARTKVTIKKHSKIKSEDTSDEEYFPESETSVNKSLKSRVSIKQHHMTVDTKLERVVRRQQQNRNAAARSRENKKRVFNKMVTDLEALKQENQRLRSQLGL